METPGFYADAGQLPLKVAAQLPGPPITEGASCFSAARYFLRGL